MTASWAVRRYDADQPGLVLQDDAELTFPEPLSGLRIRVKRLFR
ncbi:MAG TPA: hypothetical protein VF306_06955 [Pirellulales bacterium]